MLDFPFSSLYLGTKKTNLEPTNTENDGSIPDVKPVPYSSPKSQKDTQFNGKFKHLAVDMR